MALRKLGPYQLISIIGRGGMGTVFKAEDMETGNIVAVKSLCPLIPWTIISALVSNPRFRL